MVEICLLGTAGMMPLPDRWLTSALIRYGGSSFLIDCGEGTQIALKEAGYSPKPIDVICFTHYHADHISGLPGLLLSMGNSDRVEPLTLVGPKGLKRVVESLRVIAPEIPFDINYIEVFGEVFDVNLCGLEISAFKVMHNITCYGYSFKLRREGKFDVAAATSLGLPPRMWGFLQKGQTLDYEGKTYTPDMVLGPERKGIKFTYCTDSRPCKSIVDAATESDLFICEGMYGDDELQSKAKKYRHMTFSEAAKMASDANVKELWLTHFSPSLIGPERYIKQTRKIFGNAHVGSDAKVKNLLFEEGDN